jgi:hypothetical protein
VAGSREEQVAIHCEGRSNEWNVAAARKGDYATMRLLLDHPSADLAAMIALRSSASESALTAAAGFAAGTSPSASCAPLLLLLRRGATAVRCPAGTHDQGDGGVVSRPAVVRDVRQ